ncbi:MAG: hypothetical protein HYR56_29530 [Acidobacteria bacterium]|nr:hypothetical protein [Acidobacteriota bacterium]MBI3421481.1 hypothetical protein [Acidobacteriota bacterium]
MSEPSFEQLLTELSADPFGWRVHLPLAFGSVFASEVDLLFMTRLTIEAHPAPLPSDSEKDLARSIMPNLPSFLREVERQFKGFNPEILEPAIHLIGPHVLIDREDIQYNGEQRWMVILPYKEDPAYRTVVEFDASQCLGIWAGD